MRLSEHWAGAAVEASVHEYDAVAVRITCSILVALSACSSVHHGGPDAAWTRLFDGTGLGRFEPTRFGGEGDVHVEDGRIVLGIGGPLTGVTWTAEFPTTDYEVALSAMRVDGSDFFCGLTVPVADSHCSLILGGWGGTLTGISSIDGEDASENATRRFIGYRQGVPYAVRLRVTAERLQAWLDDEPIVDVDLRGRTLSIRPEVEPSKPFGIAAFATEAAVWDVRVRRLNP